jgi:hypothetical protein
MKTSGTVRLRSGQAETGRYKKTAGAPVYIGGRYGAVCVSVVQPVSGFFRSSV